MWLFWLTIGMVTAKLAVLVGYQIHQYLYKDELWKKEQKLKNEKKQS